MLRAGRGGVRLGQAVGRTAVDARRQHADRLGLRHQHLSDQPPCRRRCKVRMDRDGNVVVQCGTQDIGTGTYTVMTQVAADALGMPMHRDPLRARRFRPAAGAGVRRVDDRRRAWRRAVQAAARRWWTRSRTWRWRIGNAGWHGQIPRRAADPRRAGRRARTGACRSPRCWSAATSRFIEAEVEDPARRREAEHSRCTRSARSSPRCGSIPTWARSGSAAYVGAFDGGRILNAKTARSQLIGGITYGIGMALLEETLVDGETGRDRQCQRRRIPDAGERRHARYPDDPGARTTTPTPIRWVQRASANCRWSASPRRSPTRFITRPACASARCRSGSRMFWFRDCYPAGLTPPIH